ncbi:MAG: hypothetical protein K2M87_03470 [Muribaculaceae bacterium]|nr:hypothetical protein [Muribaculaceae bacterium]
MNSETDMQLLEQARRCWDGWREFRRERDRCKRFTYGDQWKDPVIDHGRTVTEEELIVSQGNLPLKNNLIRRLVRNVLGIYRQRYAIPRVIARDPLEAARAATINTLLDSCSRCNRLEELYSRTLEEFLISGMAVHKKWFGRRDGRTDCWTDIISPSRFFIDKAGRDFRGSDISIIGEVHDMRADDLVATFAKAPSHAASILGHYGLSDASGVNPECQVWEVWQKVRTLALDCHDRQLGRRVTMPASAEPRVRMLANQRAQAGLPALDYNWMPVEAWRYSFLTPDGYILARGYSPYHHGSHPYIFKAYPFIDGEVHSFVGDIIDQQKLTNRLISMYDWVLRASAKGVLLFPEGALPEGVDMADVVDEWSRFNGVIVYKPRSGVPLPQQVSSKSADIGITELLGIQMKMMEDISGVNGALQGKLDNGSMSGTLYDQQTKNSLSALADLLGSFEDFTRRGTLIDVANIRQFYTRRRVEAIAGVSAPDLSPTPDFLDSCLDFKI